MGPIISLPLSLISPLTGYLTPHYLALSVIVFLALGFTAFIGGGWIVPWLRKKSLIEHPTFDFPEPRTLEQVFDDSPMGKLGRFAFRYVLGLKTIRRMPIKPIWFLLYLFPFSIVFLTVSILTFELLTSVGLRSPLTLQGLYYDLVFARSNGLPNGSHILSYLSIVLLMWVAAIKFRDGLIPNLFLGGLIGLMAVGVHEGIWVGFYYAEYGQYLHAGALSPNIISDWASVAMYVLFIVGFWKYPARKPKMRAFFWPAVAMFVYTVGWYFVPVAFGYTPFPVATVNNPEYGQTIYNITQYWSDPWTNLIEVLSWVLPAVLFMVVTLRANIANR